ncbi:cytochrome b/b6 domain-containing protein [Terasakiella sp. A23]|uniref:cytochrome b/b6 domain-containing protein n=1 Tax=Terasakiella sp. FCG-A23 TaxID=3080561 RepID=UPI0029543E5A|nr:cytochrome b/b6 domain-containing protein [Terasakiella sp. A23]MDV7340216.1 cytochrome b/b6 domain-containing protein [Terasakiella sp. A23]
MTRNKSYSWKRVWDLPTRAFHWLLVISVCTGWWLGENLSFSNISWHFYLGYTTGGLVLFRLIWGLIGPKYIRLSALFHKPQTTLDYVAEMKSREPSGYPGHSPVGSLSVLGLLAVLALQVVTGLFAEADDLFSAGPLSSYVGSNIVQLANAIHEINSKILLAMVVLHLAALMFYLIWKRENLIRAMVTGKKMLLDKKDDI